MRRALSGSLFAHAVIIGAAVAGFAWPQAQDDAPAAGSSVEVEIVSLATVSSNMTETVESSATHTLVSAGASESVPVVTETLEPIEPVDQAAPPETVEVAQAETPEPAAARPVTAETVESVEPVAASETILAAQTRTVSPQEVAPLEVASIPEVPRPVTPQTLEPVADEDVKIAPVPQTLTIARRSEPTYVPQPRRETPPPRQSQQEPRRTPPTQTGNGGQSNADSVAARASAGEGGSEGMGGSAEVARYPSQVLSKLRRALRYPSGAGGAAGEVHVTFTVAANGAAGGIGIARSSGNAAIDRAGLETVQRAAPFPAIPPGAGRQSWTFTVPLAFVRQ